MIPASEAYKLALTGSHTAFTRAVVQQPKADNTYEDGLVVAVAAGNMTIDGTRNIWRQANLTLSPNQPDVIDPLMEIGEDTRIRIERGIAMLNGTTEWVTIATLQVQEATRSLGTGTLQVSAYDTASFVTDDTLVTPYAPIGPDQQPLTTVAAIKDLVEIALWEIPTWVIDPAVDQTVFPAAGTVFTGSRWDAVNNLAKSISAVAFPDSQGIWHIRKIDTTDFTTVATLTTGVSGVIVSGTTSKSRQEQYNAVPLRWEGPTGGGLVFVVDSDPDSPTYWNGPYGKKPAPEQSVATVVTQQQAVDAATALLQQFKGVTAKVSFTSVHNPLLEPFDLIQVIVDTRVNQIHVIDSINYELAGGSMTMSTRAVKNL